MQSIFHRAINLFRNHLIDWLFFLFVCRLFLCDTNFVDQDALRSIINKNIFCCYLIPNFELHIFLALMLFLLQYANYKHTNASNHLLHFDNKYSYHLPIQYWRHIHRHLHRVHQSMLRLFVYLIKQAFLLLDLLA